MIGPLHPSQYPDLCQEEGSLQSIFHMRRKDGTEGPAIVSLHPAENVVAVNGLRAVVATLVDGGATAGDFRWEGREDRADQVQKYKNDPHAGSVWCGLTLVLRHFIVDNYCSIVSPGKVICI